MLYSSTYTPGPHACVAVLCIPHLFLCSTCIVCCTGDGGGLCMVVVVVATFICIYNSVELELFVCELLLACSLLVIIVKCEVQTMRCRIRSFVRGRRKMIRRAQ